VFKLVYKLSAAPSLLSSISFVSMSSTLHFLWRSSCFGMNHQPEHEPYVFYEQCGPNDLKCLHNLPFSDFTLAASWKWKQHVDRSFRYGPTQHNILEILCRLVLSSCHQSTKAHLIGSLPGLDTWRIVAPEHCSVPKRVATTIMCLYGTLALQLGRDKPCQALFCRLALVLEAGLRILCY
jgi:hypothetical protein